MQNAHAIFETGSATHVGRVRARNEDSYLARPEMGIWAVADGMGGHADGDVASQTLIRAMESIGRPTSAAALLDLLEDSIAHVNSRLRELGQKRGEVVGTTLAVLLASDGYYACIWSGDSRIYLIRDRQIVQLSRDHTEVQDLLSEGSITDEEARNWAGRNGITRAIGVYDEPELEMTSGPLSSGDAFVVCSDGLTNHVHEDEIRRCVDANVSQQACEELIALTLERGALDNVTVVVARYRPGDKPRMDAADASGLREQAK
jgi:serine/threonine protein phosphatase PrpC